MARVFLSAFGCSHSFHISVEPTSRSIRTLASNACGPDELPAFLLQQGGETLTSSVNEIQEVVSVISGSAGVIRRNVKFLVVY